MSRLPQRRSSLVQTDAVSDNGNPADPGKAPGSQIGLGWRVCILVWVIGFFGLFIYELWGLLWKVGKGMFGTAS